MQTSQSSRDPANGGNGTGLGSEARRAVQARASPEGIVTIIFTDIVGSTRLRQRLGDDVAQERFREHNRLVREQIQNHGGFEVKTQGDGFMIAFGDVLDALACVRDVQRTVAEDNKRHPGKEMLVKIGINSGQAIKEEEDFFGGAVVVAARLAALAKGGQILASATVRGVAGLRQDIRYRRQGRRRLKGLADSYEIWLVAWTDEEQPRGLAALWARRRLRLTVAGVALVALAGGMAAGLLLNGAGGEGSGGVATMVSEDASIHFHTEGTGRVLSGDCLKDDLVLQGSSEGEVIGDIAGHMTSVGEITYYVAKSCQEGFASQTFTVTDAQGNKVIGTMSSPLSLTFSHEGDDLLGATSGSSQPLMLTSGSGIYQGISGTGACSITMVGRVKADSSVPFQSDGDCTIRATTAGAAAGRGPLIVQLGVSPLRVAVPGHSGDLPDTAVLAVIYRNTREQEQRGMSLRLPVPKGAEIVAGSRIEQQPPEGERVWALPDLAPGDIERFEFTLQFLKTVDPTVPIVVEVLGEGFQQPVRSDPVTIEVEQ
jgi:class 3 adenylate cyclase